MNGRVLVTELYIFLRENSVTVGHTILSTDVSNTFPLRSITKFQEFIQHSYSRISSKWYAIKTKIRFVDCPITLSIADADH